MAERTYDGGTIWERRSTAGGDEWVEYSPADETDRDAQTRRPSPGSATGWTRRSKCRASAGGSGSTP